MTRDKLTGPWTLEQLRNGEVGMPSNGLRVFSCFHCGGGSTMGYKLAGFKVIGGVEIDPKMMRLYRQNFTPDIQYSFEMPIQKFKGPFPPELQDIDVLDGSPPCSSFSMAGAREKDWGKKKKFREGQAEQMLDDLFFHFVDVAEQMRPKVVVAENVKGLIMGHGRGYVKDIFSRFRAAGYDTQLFLLNSATMGVPQARERTFFIARRSDLGLQKINLSFNETQISASQATAGCRTDDGAPINVKTKQFLMWKRCLPGENFSQYHPNGSCFTLSRVDGSKPAMTVTSQILGHNFHWSEPRNFSSHEIIRLQSFPEDYDFMNQGVGYVCGMSVPPFMMMRVASEIARQQFGIEQKPTTIRRPPAPR